MSETAPAPLPDTALPRRRFYASVLDFLRDLPQGDRAFWVLVIATGTASGLGAVALVHLLHLIQAFAWPAAPTLLEAIRAASGLRRVVVLSAAGGVTALASLALGRSLAGHGTAGIMEAIWLKSGAYSLRRAFTNGIAAIVVVGLGAPLGREGALISTGAGVGSWLARRLSIEPDLRRVLVACGAASGIAAAYNAPLGAAVFGLEVFLGSFALELLGPIVVACVTSTLVAHLFDSSHATYEIPYYRLGSPSHVLVLLALAPIFGLASALYVRVIERFEAVGERLGPRLAPFVPVAALFLVGLAACVFPEVLGNGYEVVNEALLGHLPLTLLIVLPLLKMLLTALSSGSGVPGGLFTPSLFYGALVGGALGQGVEALLGVGIAPGAYALVGMAAVLAGTTHATASSVLIIFEMTRDYGVILPLMLTSVVATAVSRALEGESLYTGVLKRRNVLLPDRPMPSWWGQERVEELVDRKATTVPPHLPFEEVVMRLLGLPSGEDLYVVDRDGRYAGAIVLDALKGNLPERGELVLVVAADIADKRIQALSLTISLSSAVERLSRTTLDRLPVVDDDGRVVGTLSKRALLSSRLFGQAAKGGKG